MSEPIITGVLVFLSILWVTKSIEETAHAENEIAATTSLANSALVILFYNYSAILMGHTPFSTAQLGTEVDVTVRMMVKINKIVFE